MSIKSFVKSLLPRELDFEAQVQDDLPRWEAMGTAELREQLHDCWYLHMERQGEGRIDMDETEVAQRLLAATTPEHYQALVDDWSAVLTALRQAEHETGYRGRPMLLDYDLFLTCVVRVLATRAR